MARAAGSSSAPLRPSLVGGRSMTRPMPTESSFEPDKAQLHVVHDEEIVLEGDIIYEDEPAARNLAPLLEAVEEHLRRYVVLSEAQYVAVTLWIVHANAVDATSTTPYLHITSPELESGKS